MFDDDFDFSEIDKELFDSSSSSEQSEQEVEKQIEPKRGVVSFGSTKKEETKEAQFDPISNLRENHKKEIQEYEKKLNALQKEFAEKTKSEFKVPSVSEFDTYDDWAKEFANSLRKSFQDELNGVVDSIDGNLKQKAFKDQDEKFKNSIQEEYLRQAQQNPEIQKIAEKYGNVKIPDFVVNYIKESENPGHFFISLLKNEKALNHLLTAKSYRETMNRLASFDNYLNKQQNKSENTSRKNTVPTNLQNMQKSNFADIDSIIDLPIDEYMNQRFKQGFIH